MESILYYYSIVSYTHTNKHTHTKKQQQQPAAAAASNTLKKYKNKISTFVISAVRVSDYFIASVLLGTHAHISSRNVDDLYIIGVVQISTR